MYSNSNKQKKERAQARAERAENQKIDDIINLEPDWSSKCTFNQLINLPVEIWPIL